MVSRPNRLVEVKISGFDPLTREDIGVVIATLGSCAVSLINVGEVKRMPGGLRIAWIECPIDVAKKLTAEEFITIGWTTARISKPRIRSPQCYRCWHFGHTRGACKAPFDRAGLCFLCAEPGHNAKDYTGAACCVVYMDNDLDHCHRVGFSGCASAARFSRAL